MLISLEIHMKTPNTQDFCRKNIQFECFYAEYTENLELFYHIFPKNQKIAIFCIKLISNLTIWVEKSEKSDFSVK